MVTKEEIKNIKNRKCKIQIVNINGGIREMDLRVSIVKKMFRIDFLRRMCIMST